MTHEQMDQMSEDIDKEYPTNNLPFYEDSEDELAIGSKWVKNKLSDYEYHFGAFEVIIKEVTETSVIFEPHPELGDDCSWDVEYFSYDFRRVY